MTLVTLLLTLYSASLFAQTIGSTEDEFKDSTFIRFINENNDGHIPYPFEKLLESFGLNLAENGSILFVPKGRSLVRNDADHQSPRIIVAPFLPTRTISEKGQRDFERDVAVFKRKGFGENDLFIGFAPRHGAMEIISFNPKTKKYDFFIVEDYKAKSTPKIVNNPALCLTCHQNGGPIFPRFPWTEFIKGTPATTSKTPLPGENTVIREIKKYNRSVEGISTDENGAYQNFLRFGFDSVSPFDINVRSASRKLISIKACEALCSDEDYTCQRKVFRNVQDFKRSDFKFSEIDEKIARINLPSSVIPDIDHLSGKVFTPTYRINVQNDAGAPELSLQHFIRITGEAKSEYDGTYIEDIALLGLSRSNDFTNGKVNDPKGDPTFPRPQNDELTDFKNMYAQAADPKEKFKIVLNACFGTSDSISPSFDIELSQNYRLQSVKEAFAHVDLATASDDVIKNLSWPILGRATPIGLKEARSKGKVLVIKGTNVSSVVQQPAKSVNQEGAALFKMYCAECHDKSGTIPLPLSSMDSLSNYIPVFNRVKNMGPQERLEKNIMPPEEAISQPTEEERQRMIEILKQFKR